MRPAETKPRRDGFEWMVVAVAVTAAVVQAVAVGLALRDFLAHF